MLIWGSKGQETEIGSGLFHCPQCDGEQPYKHIRIGKYFTLYFVPLFETKGLAEYIKCQTCQQTFKPEVLSYKPPTQLERAVRAIRADLATGTPLQMAYRKLVNAGVESDLAGRIVIVAAGDGCKVCGKCKLAFMATAVRCAACGGPLEAEKPQGLGQNVTATPPGKGGSIT